jgi:hypothetical protein
VKKKLVMLMNRNTIKNIKSKTIKKDILSMYNYLYKKKFFNERGDFVKHYFFKKIYENINIDNINNSRHYGFVIKFTEQRLIPSVEKLFDNPTYQYFDRNQNNGLDIGEPVIVMHKSHDNKWLYVLSKFSGGWVKSSNIAMADYSDIAIIDKVNTIIITEGKADLYENSALTRYVTTTRMGNRYILTGVHEHYYELLIPLKDKNSYIYYKKFYIDKKDANIGYLPFTQRNIILQAFKLLNTPYGWGDMAQEQDCSKFIQEVFLTFGITLPRNSSAQVKTGINLYLKKKNKGQLNEIINHILIPGITIIQIPGHIMLYLGEYMNEHYVIHDFFGTKNKKNNKIYNLIINKVEVTPLSLGQEGQTLTDRIRSINQINIGSFN